MRSRSRADPVAHPIDVQRVTWALLVAALVGIVVFLNTLDNGLTYDDPRILETASRLGDSGVPQELRGRSLAFLSHAIDDVVWRGWLPGRRLTQLALYALVVVLVTATTLRWTRSVRTALLVGLVFAVHPVHVEPVAALGFRKDILALLFALLAVLCLQSSLRTVPRLLLTGSWLVLGLMSKEVAVIGVVPFLFFAECTRRDNGICTTGSARPATSVQRSICRIAPLAILAVVVTLLFGNALHSPTGSGGLLARFQAAGVQQITEGRLQSYGQVLVSTAASFPEVLRLLLFPFRLSIDYPLARPDDVGAQALLGFAVFVALCACGIVLLRRRSFPAATAIVWFVFLYLPVSNMIPLTHFFLADRYLFAPSFGVCLLLGLFLDGLFCRMEGRGFLARAVPIVVATLMIGLGAVRTIDRNRDWRDDLSLWSASIRDGYPTYRGYNNVGMLLVQRGHYDQAEVSFRNALQIYPLAPDPHRSMAMLMLRKQRPDEAIVHMQAALREAPDDLVLRWTLAETLQRRNRAEEALQEYELVLQVLSADPSRGRPPISEKAVRARIQQCRNGGD